MTRNLRFGDLPLTAFWGAAGMPRCRCRMAYNPTAQRHDRMTLAERLKRLPYTPLQIAVHVYALGELALIAFDLPTDRLGANPLQAIQQRTGRAGHHAAGAFAGLHAAQQPARRGAS